MTRARRTRARRVVLSPGDVLLRAPRGVCHVGGRVADVRGGSLVVADALAAISVVLAAPAELVPGELVVVAGRASRGGIAAARVVERHPGRALGLESSRLASGVGANLAARALGTRIVREFFAAAGFLEVETPVRVGSPGLDAHVDAFGAEGGFLVTSPELHMKRLLVGGLPRIFQVARASRKDELGALHQPEFTLLEWYRAFAGMEEMIRDTEGVMVAVIRGITGKSVVRTAGGRTLQVRAPFPRVTVREAFREHARVRDAADLAASDPDRYFRLLVDRVEPGLARQDRPVVLLEFPVSEAALARAVPGDPAVAERFEVYAAGVELCNGFGELTDPTEQRRRFERELGRRRRVGAPLHPIDEPFLSALAEGMPPSGGNALGLDRLLALAVGAPTIDAVMAFPGARP